ncbi:LOW QUALITY PROTEIN: hypothetical protein CRUP_002142 [Coryphaenoides rupestris]|nr:LOW QUALITY PROTEIN: hypothetical protein CRUP_002142 [Coryphaenoides rupestris]
MALVVAEVLADSAPAPLACGAAGGPPALGDGPGDHVVGGPVGLVRGGGQGPPLEPDVLRGGDRGGALGRRSSSSSSVPLASALQGPWKPAKEAPVTLGRKGSTTMGSAVRQDVHMRWLQGSIFTSLSFSAQILHSWKNSAASALVMRKLSPWKRPLGKMAFSSASMWLKIRDSLVRPAYLGWEFSSYIRSLASLNRLMVCLILLVKFSITTRKYSFSPSTSILPSYRDSMVRRCWYVSGSRSTFLDHFLLDGGGLVGLQRLLVGLEGVLHQPDETRAPPRIPRHAVVAYRGVSPGRLPPFASSLSVRLSVSER